MAFFPPKIDYELREDNTQILFTHQNEKIKCFQVFVSKDGGAFEPSSGKHKEFVTVHALLINNQFNGSQTPMVYIKCKNNLTKQIILFSHGNSTNIIKSLDNLQVISKILGVDILAYEYTGYWNDKQKTTDTKMLFDIRVAYEFLVQKLNYSWFNIILYGQSIGSGPSVFLASNPATPVIGLILQSPVASGTNVIMKKRIIKPASVDIFPNVEFSKHVHCLTLIIHGNFDNIAPISHAHALQANFKNNVPPFLVQASHNDLLSKFALEFLKRLQTFFNQEIPDFTRNKSEQQLLQLVKPTLWQLQYDHMYKKYIERFQKVGFPVYIQLDNQINISLQTNKVTQILSQDSQAQLLIDAMTPMSLQQIQASKGDQEKFI